MMQKLHKIRKLAQDIEVQWQIIILYLENIETKHQQSSSEDEIDMQKYIKPVRTMLGQYKQSISNIRENQRLLTRSTTDQSTTDQNVCPNMGTRRKTRNQKQRSLKQLDEEIEQLTKKLQLH